MTPPRTWDRRGDAGGRRPGDVDPAKLGKKAPDNTPESGNQRTDTADPRTGSTRRSNLDGTSADRTSEPLDTSDPRHVRLGEREPTIDFTDEQIQSHLEHCDALGVNKLLAERNLGRLDKGDAPDKPQFQAFKDAVTNHVKDPDTVHYQGTFNNGEPVIYSENPNTNVVVARKDDGSNQFKTGYLLDAKRPDLAPQQAGHLHEYRTSQARDLSNNAGSPKRSWDEPKIRDPTPKRPTK